MVSRGLLLAALALAALGACDEHNQGANGDPCLKNDDCASDRCIAGTCQPKPVFGGTSDADAGSDAPAD